MKVDSLVECIKGHPGVLKKGEIYTVKDITNGVVLYEVTPPEPFKSFKKERFKEVQSPDKMKDILEEALTNLIEN
jgi:hypothetical protein